MTPRLKVYISGPISKGNRNDNFHRAAKVEEWLMLNGFAPLNPMRSMVMPHAWQENMPHSVWLECDLPWVAAADAVIRLAGESAGADMECEHAHQLNIPVLYGLEDFKSWAEENEVPE
jgi:hypothetical protein